MVIGGGWWFVIGGKQILRFARERRAAIRDAVSEPFLRTIVLS